MKRISTIGLIHLPGIARQILGLFFELVPYPGIDAGEWQEASGRGRRSASRSSRRISGGGTSEPEI